jgi:uncharacterized membrane protein YphA (DoxX/SURF4 family)
MNPWTRAFLVLLRLVIGWHFLIEGLEKVESLRRWTPVSWDKWTPDANKAWSSAGYLREATGPLAPYFRKLAGDPDDEAFAKLGLLPDDSANPKRLPPALHQSWTDYLTRFSARYKLTDDQRRLAEGVLTKSEENALSWLSGVKVKDTIVGERKTEKTGNAVSPYTVTDTPQERIATYKKQLQELRRMQSQVMPDLEKDVYGQKLRTQKSDVAKSRNELIADLDNLFKQPLYVLISPEQKNIDLVQYGSPAPKDGVPPPEPTTLMRVTDKVVAYGLVGIGGCLLFGLFSRLACLGGSGLLLMFYAAMPALPGVPEPLKAEGHYYIINKNIIEMVALLALATTASGRWFGLDALVHWIFCSKDKS